MAGSITAPGPAGAHAGPAHAAGPAAAPRFVGGQAGSVGIGLEWMVLDRETGDLCPAAPDILLLLDRQAKAWTAAPGSDASMLDTATSMLGNYRGVADQLEDIRRSLRRAAGAVGAVVAGGGVHPFHRSGRRRVHAGQGPSSPPAGFGMQIHIAVPGPDEAVRACAWLTQRAPLFIALSASSPYWQGVDSGYCSARNGVGGGLHASSFMPASLRSRQDYAHHVARLKQRGCAIRTRNIDWDVRPDTEHGAIGLWGLDAPLHPLYAAALACYARELCLEVAQRPGDWPCGSARELYQWNRFDATRRGVLGDWIDPCTRKKYPIEQIVRDDLARLVARSSDPEFPNACVLIHELLHNGGQARWLTARTAAGAGPRDLARLAGEVFARPLAPGSKVEP